jgi:hypothetical protein
MFIRERTNKISSPVPIRIATKSHTSELRGEIGADVTLNIHLKIIKYTTIK